MLWEVTGGSCSMWNAFPQAADSEGKEPSTQHSILSLVSRDVPDQYRDKLTCIFLRWGGAVPSTCSCILWECLSEGHCPRQLQGATLNSRKALKSLWLCTQSDLTAPHIINLSFTCGDFNKGRGTKSWAIHAPQNKTLAVLSKHPGAETGGNFHVAFLIPFHDCCVGNRCCVVPLFVQCWRRRWQHGKAGMNSLRKAFWRWWNKVSKNS